MRDLTANAAAGDLILIVDDDRATRMLLKRVLLGQEYQIIEAADGAEAVLRFAECAPALVLLDVMMPVLDGFQACALIRQQEHDNATPVIMLTASDDLSAIDRAFDAGATDFITKPINWTLLTQRVRYALRASALNREVRLSRLRQQSARRLSRLLFWQWRLTDDTLLWSDDLEILIGRALAAPATCPEFLAFVHREDRERVERTLVFMREHDGQVDLELRMTLGGEERLVRMLGERGQSGGDRDWVFGALQDVTDMRRTEALIDYLAFHDELTELGNRRLFISQMREALSAIRGGLEANAVLLIVWIDLHRFHRHNDALGHDAGDHLLRDFADRLRHLAGGTGQVARVGGDEFTLLLRGATRVELFSRFERMLRLLHEPFRIQGTEAFLTCSAGLSYAPENSDEPERLLALAQEAQRLARAQAQPWAEASTDQPVDLLANEALETERLLRTVLDREELFLVYQPQMDLRSGRIVGAEALLRWRHPRRGLIPPLQFIPLLEETGLIMQVGHWVIQEACQQALRWRDQGLTLRVGVNLSPRQFLNHGLYDEIQELLERWDIDPANFELEITETQAMQEPLRAIAVLERLRGLGIKIAIDDFGIGYSSMEYLLRFPIDTIKVDRAFVSHITDQLADRAIVRAIAAIGQSLGLSIIAEGVETQRQCDFLDALGVDEVQGYLIGKPMPPAELEALIAHFRRPGIEDNT